MPRRFIEEVRYHGKVDLTDIEPLLYTPEMERSKGLHQLSLRRLYDKGIGRRCKKPRTRYEHMLGAYNFASKCRALADMSPEQQKVFKAYTLTHDVGHGAESHVGENIHEIICKLERKNRKGFHDERYKQIIDDMRPAFEACGVDFNLLYETVKNDNNDYKGLRAACTSFAGVEKTEFQVVDPLSVGLQMGFDWEKILKNMRYIDETVCFEEGVYQDVLDKAWTHVQEHRVIYFPRGMNLLEVDLMSAVFDMYHDGFDVKQIWNMNDRDLMNRLLSGGKDTVYGRKARNIYAAKIPVVVLDVSPTNNSELFNTFENKYRGNFPLMFSDAKAIDRACGLPEGSTKISGLPTPERWGVEPPPTLSKEKNVVPANEQFPEMDVVWDAIRRYAENSGYYTLAANAGQAKYLLRYMDKAMAVIES